MYITENVCMFVYVFFGSLCTATVLSESGPSLACDIVVPSGLSWEVASAARARGLAPRSVRTPLQISDESLSSMTIVDI